MCGIVGILAPQAAGTSTSGADLVREMAGTLRHRGPDAEGFADFPGVSIGMTRLSIIDLETGDPPISNEDGSIWVVFNGEIYNYAQRRARLQAAGHEFRTTTDTEVIVHEYEEHGAACVEHFRGMFSLAVWDSRRKQLLLARDRFGIKPLFVAAEGGSLAFASEMKALLRVPWVDRSWDATAVEAYLRLGYAPLTSTPYRGIRKFAPGTVAVWDWDPQAGASQNSNHEYWAPSGREHAPVPSFAEAAWEVAWRLRESVRLRLRSDVPLGAFLSGGVDSSAIVAAMRAEGVDDLATFSIGFQDAAFNELPYADAVAKHFRTRHYSRVVTAADALVIPDLLEQFDEPFADSSAIPTFFVSRLAREHVTVALTGDGGDELFGGYPYYRSLAGYRLLGPVPSAVSRRIGAFGGRFVAEDQRGAGFLRRLGTEPAMRQLEYLGAQLPDMALAALGDGFKESLRLRAEPDFLERTFATDGSPRSALLQDQRCYMVDDILTKVDRMSMAVSLEARVPLLDHTLAEYVNGLPVSYKLGLHTSKRVLRSALADAVPHQVLDRGKKGFSIPLRSWLAGPLRGWARETLLSASPFLIDQSGVRQLLDGLDDAQRDFSFHLWNLLSLTVWARAHESGWE